MTDKLVLVPVEPTEEMRDAGRDEAGPRKHLSVTHIYQRMIAASPVPPIPEYQGLVDMLTERDGQSFDGEVHLTSGEGWEIRAALTHLATQLEQVKADRDSWRRTAERCKQEAIGHAQEARTANSTIYEIYQVLSGGKGEPGNWNGAEPARRYVEAAERSLSEARDKALEEAAALIEQGYDRAGIERKSDPCDHGLFGWDNCDGCASAAIRALKFSTERKA